jgi:hypothetical protein
VDVVPPGDGGAATARWEVVVEVDGEEVRRVRVEPERTTWTDDVALPAGPGTARVAAALLVDGRVVARDVADVVVLAPVLPRARPVQVDDDALADWLPRLAVPLVDRAPQEGLLVTRCFGPRAQAHARAGGRVLVLAEDRDALGGAFAAPLLARLSPREGDGDWVPRFDWLRRSGPLAALPGGPLLDLAFEHVIGAWVIDFLPAPLRPARLHSAVFAGWLQHRASTTVTVPWSRGAVTITTFRVREAGVDDAAAVALARALLDVAEDA